MTPSDGVTLTASEAARIAGGALVLPPGASPATEICGVSVDSRDVAPGNLFVAIRGEHADGHDHVRAAFSAGAAAAMVCRGVTPLPGVLVEVAEPLQALRRLAAYTRDLVDPVVVGITGSTGKTSTKDLLSSVAGVKFRTVSAERSYNNELGVPLTLLKAGPGTEVLICELGARGTGQIRDLCSYVRPRIGIVTNVGVTHFEQFGSAEAILAAKSELPGALPVGGVAVLNADDERVAGMSRITDAEVVTYGTAGDAWVRAESIELDRLGRARFRLVRDGERLGVHLQMGGRHQVSNALAAAAAGLVLGLSLDEVQAGLQAAAGSPWRMEVSERDGVVVVNDAYNANPTSMAAALSTCAAMVPAGGRLLAVLGAMAELGAIEAGEHEQVGVQAAAVVQRLVVVGERAHPIAAGARRCGLEMVAELPADAGPDAVRDALGPLHEGDVVLVKASRVAGLERVAALLPGGLRDGTAS